jgi:hypothetical protein
VFRNESALEEHLQLYHPGRAAALGIEPPPPAEPSAGRPVGTHWIVLGYVGAVLFPIAGLIIGTYLVTKDVRGHGFAAIAISIAVGAASLLLTSPVR